MSVLMYHDVVAAGAEDTSGFAGPDCALYKVTPDRFAEQIDAVLLALPASRVPMITFDDGGKSGLVAAAMLEARGLRGYFFITASYIGIRGFLTEDDIRDLARRGHAIGSHSCSHPLRMGHCSWPQLLDEWQRSRAILSDIVGDEVRMASVPGGDFTPQVADAAARSGITALFTSEPTLEVRYAFGATLVGRFAIQRWTSAATAAALAAGSWLPCATQAAIWSAKKLTKQIGGQRYLRLRKLLLGHGDAVRWGDQR